MPLMKWDKLDGVCQSNVSELNLDVTFEEAKLFVHQIISPSITKM